MVSIITTSASDIVDTIEEMKPKSFKSVSQMEGSVGCTVYKMEASGHGLLPRRFSLIQRNLQRVK